MLTPTRTAVAIELGRSEGSALGLASAGSVGLLPGSLVLRHKEVHNQPDSQQIRAHRKALCASSRLGGARQRRTRKGVVDNNNPSAPSKVYRLNSYVTNSNRIRTDWLPELIESGSGRRQGPR